MSEIKHRPRALYGATALLFIAFAAVVSAAAGGAFPPLELGWGTVWLGLATAEVVLLGYGCVLAWSARHDQDRLETRGKAASAH